MRRNLVFLLTCGIGLLTQTPGKADVYTFSFTANTVTTTAEFYNINTAGATGRARAFHLNGDWTVAGGDPWSTELRAQITGLTNQGGGALERVMGGVGNGNPFTFGPPTNTTSNQGQPPRGMLANIAAADLGGIMSLGLRQTFDGSSANFANASITFYTDVIAPIDVTLDANSPTMSARPNSLTSTTAGTFRYQANTFVAQDDGAHHFGFYINGADGFLLVYDGAFDPNNPLTNLIGLDDDGDLGIPNSSSLWLNLAAGNSYTLVATTFSSGDIGLTGFQSIAGPAVAIPEPATIALIGMAGAGLYFTAKRRISRRRKAVKKVSV